MKSKIEAMYEKFINFEDIHLKSFYLTKKEFINDYERYLKDHQDNKELLEAMKNTVTIGQRSVDNLSVFYVDKPFKDGVTEYVHYFQELYLLYIKDKESAYRKAKNTDNSTTFNTKLKRFEKRFYNSILYMDVFKDIDEHIIIEKKRKTFLDVNLIKQYHVDSNVLVAIYESNMSLLDYAFYNSIDYNSYSCYLRHASNDIADAINSRVDTVQDKIKDLIIKIGTGQMDYVDYYKECKLKPGHLRRLLSEVNVHGALISNFISDSRKTPISETKELEGTLVINSVEVPKEIKEKAINYLKEIDAPLTQKNYKTLIRRYIQEI